MEQFQWDKVLYIYYTSLSHECLKIAGQNLNFLPYIKQNDSDLGFCLAIHSSWGSSKAGRGRGPKFHSTKGDVALPDAGQTERSDPWLPGSLCACGKWRGKGPAPHQGRHAGRCAGMIVSQFPQYKSIMSERKKSVFHQECPGLPSSFPAMIRDFTNKAGQNNTLILMQRWKSQWSTLFLTQTTNCLHHPHSCGFASIAGV